MKKTLIALMALAGSVAANTVIYDLSSTTQTYGTYEDITFLTSGNVTDATSTQTATLNGATVSFKAVNGTGSGRGMLGDGAKWSNGLPIDLGLTTTDINTLTSTGAYIVGNTQGYPGVMTLTISGLAKGTYSLSALSAKGTGDTSPLTMSLTVGGNSWSSADYLSDATFYTYANNSWGEAVAGQPSFAAVANNKPSAAYAVFDNIEITSDNTTLVLSLTGTPANDANQNLKALQFVSLKVVPEPTTATLSLLALAGLAARRRRK